MPLCFIRWIYISWSYAARYPENAVKLAQMMFNGIIVYKI